MKTAGKICLLVFLLIVMVVPVFGHTPADPGTAGANCISPGSSGNQSGIPSNCPVQADPGAGDRQGATVFISEQGLNLTGAANATTTEKAGGASPAPTKAASFPVIPVLAAVIIIGMACRPGGEGCHCPPEAQCYCPKRPAVWGIALAILVIAILAGLYLLGFFP